MAGQWYTTKKFILLLFLLSSKEMKPFSRVTVPWENGNNQIFWGLLDTGSALALHETQMSRGSPVRVGIYGRVRVRVRVLNTSLTLTHSDL